MRRERRVELSAWRLLIRMETSPELELADCFETAWLCLTIMLFLFDVGTTPGLCGTGGAGDIPLVFSMGKVVLEDVAGWLEGGVELA